MTSLLGAWFGYPVPMFARWLRQQGVRLPVPLSSSALGTFRFPMDELTGAVPRREAGVPDGEQRTLQPVLRILARPSQCCFVVRSETGGPETYYVGMTGGDYDDEAVVLVVSRDQVRLSGVYASQVADAVARELPALRPAPVGRVELDAWRRSRIEAGEASLASAGAPEEFTRWLQVLDTSRPTAVGTVDAVEYRRGGVGRSPCSGHFTELSQGGMISATNRKGGIVHEPLSAVAVRRALTEAMAGLD